MFLNSSSREVGVADGGFQRSCRIFYETLLITAERSFLCSAYSFKVELIYAD